MIINRAEARVLILGLLRRCLFRSNTDGLDFHARQFAPMPNRAVITFAPLKLKRDDLLVLALFDNFSSHLCSGDERVPMRHVFSVGKHQHVTERRGLARIDIEKIDIDCVAFRDPKLSAQS